MTVRATRRRHRKADPLASPAAVRAVCSALRARIPDVIPSSEKHLIRFLNALRHVERRPASDTRRGRPGRWPRERLTEAASQLRGILERETSGRISLSSFVGQYLPILQFPSDVAEALAGERMNLQEAAQLARLTPERLGCTAREARARREELLRQHLAVQGSQPRLRTRVKEILGEVREDTPSPGGMAEIVAKVDELLEVDPTDTRHLFWEEMKRLFYAMREIEPEDLDEQTMDDFLRATDEVSKVLYRIERRRKEREAQRRKAFPK